MTKEELLKKLKKIGETMNLVIAPDENISEYSVLVSQRDALAKEISDLKLKLSDNSNYPNSNYISSKTKLERVTRTLDQLNLELERNQANILSNSNRIQDIDREISACNELISQDEKELEELGKTTDSGNSEVQKIQEHRDLLKSDLTLLTAERESLTTSLNSMSERNKDINLMIERFQQVQASTTSKSTEKVNRSNKLADQNRLASLEASLDQIEATISYVETNAPEEISNLVTEIQLGVISDDDIIPRLEQIKSNLPEVFMGLDQEKIDENKSKQSELSSQISDLQTKLSDTTNYTPSMLATEVTNAEVEDSERRIAEIDEAIKQSDFNIHVCENYVERLNDAIDERKAKSKVLSDENDDIRFRMTDASLSTEEYSSLNKQRIANEKKIQKINANIERCEKLIMMTQQSISLDKKNRKAYETLKNTEIKDLETVKQLLEDNKTVNKLAMIKDQRLLAVLNIQLSALTVEEKLLNCNINQDIDEIISTFAPSQVTAEEITVPSSTIEFDENIDVVDTTGENLDDADIAMLTEVKIDEIDKTVENNEFSIDSMETIIDDNDKKTEEIQDGQTVVDSEEIEKIMGELSQDVLNLSGSQDDMMTDESVLTNESKFEEMSPEDYAKYLETTGNVSLVSEKRDPIAIVSFRESTNNLVEQVRNSYFIKALKKKIYTVGLVVNIVGATALPVTASTIEDKNNLPEEFVSNTEVTEDSTISNLEISDSVIADDEFEVSPTIELDPEVTFDVTPEETFNENSEEALYENPEETIDVTQYPVEDLAVSEFDGNKIVFDNSDVDNSDVITEQFDADFNYDYPESEEIGDVTWDGEDASTVTVEEPKNVEQSIESTGYNSDISPEEQAMLDAYLQEQLDAVNQDSIDQGRNR